MDINAGSIGGGAISGAAAGASFGPYGMAIGAAVGIGFQLFGASQASDAAKEQNAAQVRKIELEKKVEEQHRVAMELDANRKNIENIRQVQRARAASLTSATSQGASGAGSSGLAGGLGQISAQGAWNSLGISQNLQIGRSIFDINAQISNENIALANAGVHSQEAAGYSSLGTNIMGSLGAVGRLSSGFGNNAPKTNTVQSDNLEW